MVHFVVVLLLSFVLQCNSFGVLRSKIADAPSFLPIGTPLDADPVRITLFLKQNNLDELKKTFEAVSDPRNPSWRKFLSRHEIDAMVKPDDDIIKSYRSWLASYASTARISEGADYFQINTDVATASQIFQTSFAKYQHPHDRTQVLHRVSTEASIPLHLASSLHYIAGLADVTPRFKITGMGGKTRGLDKRSAAYQQNPARLKSYYNVDPNLKGSDPSNVNCVVAFYDWYSDNALTAFSNYFNLTTPKITTSGTNCLPQGCDQVESDLDVQYITSMAEGIPVYFDGNTLQTTWAEWAETISTKFPILPHVFSISYGSSEIYTSQDELDRFETAVQKLALQGSTIMVSSGDDGAMGIGASTGNCPADLSTYCPGGQCAVANSSCQQFVVTQGQNTCVFPVGTEPFCRSLSNNNGFKTALNTWLNKQQTSCAVAIDDGSHLRSKCTCNALAYGVTANGFTISQYTGFTAKLGSPFDPSFPASSPSVTSISASVVDPSGNSFSEIPTSFMNDGRFDTGGGFSLYYPQPSYQANAVASWKSQREIAHQAPTDYYDDSKRAYPDITFNGAWYQVVQEDSQGLSISPIFGTSASTPALAGLIGMVNEQLIAQGKPTLGFLNPLLYQLAEENPSAFRDLTGVSNRCNRNFCCQYGFVATPGYDPVSGLGSPDFAQLSALLIDNQAAPAHISLVTLALLLLMAWC